MAVQTEYKEVMDAYRAGMIVNMEPKSLVDRNVEGADIGFGKPVARGDDDKGVRATQTGDTEIFGIAVRERSTLNDKFEEYDAARIMRTMGVIAVEVATAVSAGDPVHVDVAAGTFSNAGGVVYPGASFDTSGAAGALVELRLA